MRDLLKTYLAGWKGFADFKGHANRKEFWVFILFNWGFSTIFFILGAILLAFLNFSEGNLYLASIALILTIRGIQFIPNLSILVRRLHDTGKSGWWSVGLIIVDVLRQFTDAKTLVTFLINTPILGFLFIITAIASMICFIFTFLPSKETDNSYAPR